MNNTDADVLIRSIKRISLENGDVLRAVKATDQGFCGFGEAYFSYIHYQAIKAWKRHTNHTANFICPLGKVKIILYKESAPGQLAPGYPKEFILAETEEHYQCLTVMPGVWYGFEGLAKPSSLIFSLLNGEHSQDEQKGMSLAEFPYPWT